MSIQKVAILTAGGLAPCLSSSIGHLIQRYTEISPTTEIICYFDGYKGLLLGDSVTVSPDMREKAHILFDHGGSPIGNSRVKLTNIADCEKRGLVQKGENPLEVAAKQLVKGLKCSIRSVVMIPIWQPPALLNIWLKMTMRFMW